MSIAASARVTLASQWTRLLVQVVGFIVLSRLLDPAEFGLVAMVAPVVVIAGVFADFGLSLAGIQAPTLTQGQKSTLLWLNVVAGLAAAVVVGALGPLLALFYGEPRLVLLTLVLAIPLLLSSVSVQFRVELTRAGRYGALALADVLSALAGLIAATAAALAGAGYWALAAQSVTQALVLVVMAVAQARWLPTRPAPIREVRSMLVFGGNSLALQLANLVSTSFDQAMVGRSLGAEVLGLYSRASQLVSMLILQIVSPLTRVSLPRLAKAETDADFNRDLQRTQSVIVLPLLAAVSLLAAVAPAGIVVFFGEAWEGAGPLTRILCAGAAFQAVGYVYYWGLLARARTGLLLVAELPGRVVMVAGAFLLAPVGAWAVAAAMSVGQLVIFVGSTIVVHRAGIETLAIVRLAVRPAVVAGIAFLAAFWVTEAMPVPALTELLAGLAVWAVVMAASLAVPAVRGDVRALARSIRR
ncbi:oligosaccharide flippase family protein [Microbacterium sp. GXF7504]